jgi:uncharacterized membrane-anchored protein
VRLKKGAKTKDLVKKLRPGDLALINHADIDWVAAESLERKGASGVINAASYITGTYPNLGPSYLLGASIPMWEIASSAFDDIPEEAEAEIRDGILFVNGSRYPLRQITKEDIEEGLKKAQENLPLRLHQFTTNTLEYAKKEMALLTKTLPVDHLKEKVYGREAVVVVRGYDYRKDLKAIASFIEDRKPFLVAVDGGADALWELGYKPDMIVGDMDSVSDKVLRLGADIVLHAYPDGRAPGLLRLQDLGLNCTVVPCEGTSEDLAFLILNQLGASIIITVGSHSSMIDFLEKGRKGMASTFLARLRAGDKLVDARGLSVIYRARPKNTYAFLVILAAFIPLVVLILVSPPVASWLKIFLRQIRF